MAALIPFRKSVWTAKAPRLLAPDLHERPRHDDGRATVSRPDGGGGCKFTARVPAGEGGYLPALSLPHLGASVRNCLRRVPYLSLGPLSTPSASSNMTRPSSEGLGGSDFPRKANVRRRGSNRPSLPMRPVHARPTISHRSHNWRSGLNPQVAATWGHERHGQQRPSNRLRKRALQPLATEAAGYRATPRASKSGPKETPRAAQKTTSSPQERQLGMSTPLLLIDVQRDGPKRLHRAPKRTTKDPAKSPKMAPRRPKRHPK